MTSPGSAKLAVKCQDDTDDFEYPHCPHGPTLLFYKTNGELDGYKEGYFACSAYRDSKDCKFHLKFENYESFISKKPKMDLSETPVAPIKLLDLPVKQRIFCLTCNKVVSKTDLPSHPKHKIIRNILDEQLRDPTKFLRPLNNDKAEAQYFFDEKTLKFFGECFQSLGIGKVICIGAPRLHFYLKNNCKEISSMLLDLDDRFDNLCNDTEYAKFNMCNNYFFGGEEKRKVFEKFLKEDDGKKVLLFTDPPFACRTEPIVSTITSIRRTYNQVNNSEDVLPIFWVFPYYFESYIKKSMPEMEMSDYRINYTNHQLFSDGENGRQLGSPIRFFTNVSLANIKLSPADDYKLCKTCKIWTSTENAHCTQCKKCPSKSGHTYRHCNQCGQCVKPNYKHCIHCRRCTQVENHKCSEYQKNLHCWICRKKGHCEWTCSEWLNRVNRLPLKKTSKVIFCLLCEGKGHNEQNCSKRAKLLEESLFMGNVVNIFS